MSEPCGVCAGTGTPASGKPCICQGIGTQDAELQGFRELVYEQSADIAALREALAHATASLDHLMAFKGSRLEETQRKGHLLNIERARRVLEETNPTVAAAPRREGDLP
jgi:hypothetical protein